WILQFISGIFRSIVLLYFIFFFQAEDGIRDSSVTGVQTCALPISDCQRIYGWPFTSTWVSPLPSTTWTDLAGSHPGKSRSSIAQAVSGQAHIRKRPGRKPTRNYFKLSPV